MKMDIFEDELLQSNPYKLFETDSQPTKPTGTNKICKCNNKHFNAYQIY